MIASVNVVSHEQVICVLYVKVGISDVFRRESAYWRLATDLKKLNQILELAVGVSTYCHGRSNANNVGFLRENFFGLTIRVSWGQYAGKEAPFRRGT